MTQDIQENRVIRNKMRFVRKISTLMMVILPFLLVHFYSNQIVNQIKICYNYMHNLTTNQLIKSGFSLDRIIISGNKFISKNEILNFINRDHPAIFLSLSQLHHDIIQNSPWVKEVNVRRVLPNKLYLDITEHRPFATWFHNNKFSIIDENGYVIVSSNKRMGDLIGISGDYAISDLQFIKRILNSENELKQHIVSFDRIGNRRWNLVFTNGLEVKLPEADPFQAWNYLEQMYNTSEEIMSWSSIDMRISDKIYIKK